MTTTSQPVANTRRRISNILDVYPASGWTPEEARDVLAAMESIVNRRQSSVTEYPTVPPITCTRWCAEGDGHPNEFMTEDQTCRGEYAVKVLSLVDQSETGEVASYAKRYSGGAVHVCPNVLVGSVDVDVPLTAAEACDIGHALIEAAEEIEPSRNLGAGPTANIADFAMTACRDGYRTNGRVLRRTRSWSYLSEGEIEMSADQNIETTKKGYEAFAAGDVESALSNFDDAIEWTLAGNSQVSGTYRGKNEVLGLFAKLGEQSLTTTPSRFIADGDDVVVLTDVSAGGESSSEADVYSFRDGKIVRAQSYADTAMQERVFGTK